MKVPTSCNDKRLLQDEPFLRAFQSYGQQKITNKYSQRMLANVVSALNEVTCINDVLQAWVGYAFIPMSGDSTKCSFPQHIDCTILRLFASYYSHLARDDENTALQVLNEGRRIRGFAPLDATALNRQTITDNRSVSTRKRGEERKSTTSMKGRGSASLSRSKKNPEVKDLSIAVNSRKNRRLIPSSDKSCIADSEPLQKMSNSKRSRDERDIRPFKKLALADSQTQKPKGIDINSNVTRNAENSESSSTSRQTFNRKNIRRRRLARLMQSTKPERGRSEAMVTDDVGYASKTEQESTEITSMASLSNLDCVSTVAEVLRDECPNGPLATTLTPGGAQGTGCNLKLQTSPKLQGNGLNVTQSADITVNPRSVIPTRKKDNQHRQYVTQKLICPLETDGHSSVCLMDKPEVNTPDTDLPTVPQDSAPSKTNLPSSIAYDPMETNVDLPSQDREIVLQPMAVDSTGTAISLTTEDICDINQEAALLALAKAESTLSNIASDFHPEPLPRTPYKKPLPLFPPIWAQSRQEVCESFDWFRSYQGGVYHTQETARGYLLSGFPSKRDRFEHDGRLIISHGGGRAESVHSSKGQISSQPASDQLARDKSVRALLNNYRNGRPLALLIDDKYALFPYDLGIKDITYAVLGFYTIEHAWAEYQHANVESSQVVRYKFAFRWCEDQGQPWWILNELSGSSQILTTTADRCAIGPSSGADVVKDNPDSSQLEDVAYRTCDICHQSSPRVFDSCWVCLFPDCKQFWTQTTGPYTGQCLFRDLGYSPKFLELPPHKPLPFGFQEIVTSPMTNVVSVGSQRNYHLTRGFHCSECGRLSCRSQWEQCHCSNCGKTLVSETILVSAKNIWNQTLPISFKDYLINPISDMISTSSATFFHETGRGNVVSFNLPENRGTIHHIRSGTPNGNNEADLIFLEYQRQAASGILKFRRWPLRAHKCRGSLLTSYFSHNAGKPYNYVAGDANTVPFEEAPAVCQARDLIQKRVKQALDRQTVFNEVLSAAYMERQKMAFHSDNEVGLGPLVAGLSLGSPALMHFRLHPRFDPEREKKGILLSIVLRHGDVLVMDGAGIQEYYEHTVVPNNFRIAATARQIGTAHI